MKPIRSAALIGLGALGILFGRPMAEALPAGRFAVIAGGTRAARYRAQPSTANGRPCRFDFVPPEQGAPADLVLVAVKAPQLAQAIQDIARFVGPDTAILSVLNGITSEERLEAAYPGHTVWCVAIGMDATRTGRSLVYKNAGKIQFGENDGRLSPRVQALAAFFTACGIQNEPCSDILYKQWYKLMINDGLNQAAAAYNLTYGGLAASSEAQAMMLAAMRETIAAANAEGIPLPADAADEWFKLLPTFQPDGMPSMRQDVLACRPTEVEEFAGVIRRISVRHGLAAPANDFFYRKLRAMEASYAAASPAGPAAE